MGIKKTLFAMVKEKNSNRVSIVIVGLITTLLGLLIEYANFTLYLESEQTFAILSLVAALVALTPPLYIKYKRFDEIKKIEAAFPVFLSDITSNISSGMTLPQAIRALDKGRYGIMSRHVEEISAKISWGVPFDQVFLSFAGKTGSLSLQRTVGSIIEAHNSGGTMNTVLRAVSESMFDLEKIKKERSVSVYSQMLNGYMIYFIFLGVMIGMSKFLLPTFDFGEQDTGFATSLPWLFRNIVLMQGIFAGLTIGKMSEGRIIAGVKHAMFLGVIGFTAIVLIL